ncbi:C-type lectin domain family 4 member C [Gadus morhua]|uniref:C-type lectin domain family 4 member C n=1 Tax=Gadus morhua TaxID=8049 RepID=UPI0011B665E1|nr:C-type lectin domain family 4 member C-like [Gadus morhua]
MAEVIYTRPNVIAKGRNTRGEREERIVDIVVCPESLRDQQQDYVGTEESSKSLGTGRSQRPDAVIATKCQIWAVVVLLGLLSVVMLARLIGLAVQHKKTVSMDRDVEQLLQRLKNVTEQRDSVNSQQCCPSGWDKFGMKCYRISNVLGSWNKSREFCFSQGADLVVVDSKEKMDFISRYDSYFWFGATDVAGEGMWRWVDGTVLSLDNPSWSRGGPQGGGDSNCLLRAYELNQFKWTDESCDTITVGLCEQNVIK